jgi:hypothetical protein
MVPTLVVWGCDESERFCTLFTESVYFRSPSPRAKSKPQAYLGPRRDVRGFAKKTSKQASGKQIIALYRYFRSPGRIPSHKPSKKLDIAAPISSLRRYATARYPQRLPSTRYTSFMFLLSITRRTLSHSPQDARRLSLNDEHGAKLHLPRARKTAASDDER